MGGRGGAGGGEGLGYARTEEREHFEERTD